MMKWAVLASTLILACQPSVASPEEPQFSEYQVKAAFIYSTLKFVRWPTLAHDGASVCVLGDNPFGKDLQAIAGRTVRDKVLTVKNVRTVPEAKECSIVFISKSEKSNLLEIIAQLSGSQVMTVGDTEGYGEKGVVLNFYREHTKVRFQINLEAAKKSKLKLDSRLLKLATIIPAQN
jgi:hypothetical protein